MIQDSENNTSYNSLQQVKRYFFAMRNGVIADVLRRGGSPFRYIFGLNLPQLVDASRMFGKDRELALKLWSNNTTRESMLLAPMLMPPETFDVEDARKWIGEVKAVEVADVLCHRLLRHLPFAKELVYEYVDSEHTDMERYTAGRLALNLFGNDGFDAGQILIKLKEESGPYAEAIARQLSQRLEDE